MAGGHQERVSGFAGRDNGKTSSADPKDGSTLRFFTGQQTGSDPTEGGHPAVCVVGMPVAYGDRPASLHLAGAGAAFLERPLHAGRPYARYLGFLPPTAL